MPIGILIVGLAAAAVASLLKGRASGEAGWYLGAVLFLASCALLVWLRLLAA